MAARCPAICDGLPPAQGFDLPIFSERGRGFADSPAEGGEFEPSVPGMAAGSLVGDLL
jgi:hypothetical protein